MSSANEFQLFTSLRYDPLLLSSSENSRPDLNFTIPSPFYMLAYHHGRMLEAAQHFDFHAVEERLRDGKALHRELLKRVEEWKEKDNAHAADEPLKMRILFDKDANMTVDLAAVPKVPLETLYPTSFTPPDQKAAPDPAKTFTPSPLTGGALTLGPTDSFPSVPPAPPPWTLKLDTAPTPSSPFTLLKTTKREMYDSSRTRALPATPAGSIYREVMLYNEVNELTEGTLTSLYVYRGGRWVTPPVGVPSGLFTSSTLEDDSNADEGELRKPFAGRWGHSVRSAKVGAGGQRGTSRRWALGKGFCMEEPIGVDTVSVGEGVWVSNGVRGFGYGKVVP
jgi:4-amino-4-deoxychorismate lyase